MHKNIATNKLNYTVWIDIEKFCVIFHRITLSQQGIICSDRSNCGIVPQRTKYSIVQWTSDFIPSPLKLYSIVYVSKPSFQLACPSRCRESRTREQANFVWTEWNFASEDFRFPYELLTYLQLCILFPAFSLVTSHDSWARRFEHCPPRGEVSLSNYQKKKMIERIQMHPRCRRFAF